MARSLASASMRNFCPNALFVFLTVNLVRLVHFISNNNQNRGSNSPLFEPYRPGHRQGGMSPTKTRFSAAPKTPTIFDHGTLIRAEDFQNTSRIKSLCREPPESRWRALSDRDSPPSTEPHQNSSSSALLPERVPKSIQAPFPSLSSSRFSHHLIISNANGALRDRHPPSLTGSQSHPGHSPRSCTIQFNANTRQG